MHTRTDRHSLHRLRPTSDYSVETLKVGWNVPALAAAAKDRGVLLDSGTGYGTVGRFSLFGCRPFLTLIIRDGKASICYERETPPLEGDPLQALGGLLDQKAT